MCIYMPSISGGCLVRLEYTVWMFSTTISLYYIGCNAIWLTSREGRRKGAEWLARGKKRETERASWKYAEKHERIEMERCIIVCARRYRYACTIHAIPVGVKHPGIWITTILFPEGARTSIIVESRFFSCRASFIRLFLRLYEFEIIRFANAVRLVINDNWTELTRFLY